VLVTGLGLIKISAAILLKPDKYLNKTIIIGTEETDMEQVANIFSEVLGKEI
jgi:hypothetical protein